MGLELKLGIVSMVAEHNGGGGALEPPNPPLPATPLSIVPTYDVCATK